MAISPETREHLADVARRLDAAGHGERGRVVNEVTHHYGWSKAKLYAALQREVGWSSGRKVRADKGSTSVPVESLDMLAATQRESVRANGKQILFTTTAAAVLENNDFSLPVSNSQLNRLMRQRKLSVTCQLQADAPVRMRSLHPNHVHQVDPSLCVLYYLPNGKQAMMDADKFYKNKLDNYAKVKLKCWRYCLYDHTSALIAVKYFETAGESQLILAEFLLWAWGKQPDREFHGVPKIMVWDKGSANTSATIKALAAALEVQLIEHAPGKARVKGGVENTNNLVETKFESLLKLEPVQNVAELNAAVLHWQNAFNADRLPRENSALKRIGMVPTARYHLWRRITAEQLRVLPAPEVCRQLLEGKEITRKVRGGQITFKHPQADRVRTYRVNGLDAVCDGDDVSVRPLLYGNCAINVRVARYDGEDVVYRLEADAATDDYGMPVDAPIWGESYKSLADTDTDRAAKRLDALAYPEQDAAKSRDKQKTPFLSADGTPLVAHSHLKNLDLPIGLPKRGSEISVPDRLQIDVKPLNHIEMAQALSQSITGWNAAMYAAMVRMYPDGALEEELGAVAERLQRGNSGPRLVAVGGA